MHVRAHKVRLSRPYRIREGGFTVPRQDDYCPSACTADSASVENDKYVSRLQVLSDCPVKTKIFSPQAGYHLYAPLASYPAWETDVSEAGEYVFVTAFFFGRRESAPVLPDLYKIREELGL